MDPHALVRIEVLMEGEQDGGGTVLRITPVTGPTFHAVAVPQDWYSYTGPTWIYIIETDNGLSLIDSASGLVVERLTEAFKLIRLDPRSAERVIISHGHVDHDGGALLLAREWNVDVWAHVLWDSLRFHDRFASTGKGWTLLRQAVEDDLATDEPLSPRSASGERRAKMERYTSLRQEVNVSRLVEHGETVAGLTFHHTPGHAPDEITIEKGTVLFAGDHILPEITPHPTIKTTLPETVRRTMPERYRDTDSLYGLDVYLGSLREIAQMPEDTVVMPAHRLVNRGKLHVLTVSRAREIANHHLERLEFILDEMGTTSWTLADLTKSLFRHRRLNNVYEAALHETMAHVELLLGSGDVVETPEQRFTALGTQRYLAMAN